MARFLSAAALSGVSTGMGEAGERGELLHRLGKAQALRLHDEVEDVAVLAGGKVEKLALLVVHIEGGGLFGVEGRQAPPFPPLFFSRTRWPTTSDMGSRARISSRKEGENFMFRSARV